MFQPLFVKNIPFIANKIDRFEECISDINPQSYHSNIIEKLFNTQGSLKKDPQKWGSACRRRAVYEKFRKFENFRVKNAIKMILENFR